MPSLELKVSFMSLEVESLNWFPGLRVDKISEIRCIVRACWSWGEIWGSCGLGTGTTAFWGGIWVLE